LQYGKNNNMSQ